MDYEPYEYKFSVNSAIVEILTEQKLYTHSNWNRLKLWQITHKKIYQELKNEIEELEELFHNFEIPLGNLEMKIYFEDIIELIFSWDTNGEKSKKIHAYLYFDSFNYDFTNYKYISAKYFVKLLKMHIKKNNLLPF
jgi:hypothetical protein